MGGWLYSHFCVKPNRWVEVRFGFDNSIKWFGTAQLQLFLTVVVLSEYKTGQTPRCDRKTGMTKNGLISQSVTPGNLSKSASLQLVPEKVTPGLVKLDEVQTFYR